jgi:sigma-B regulation protein RsbU (phosphoserine phosphatase)
MTENFERPDWVQQMEPVLETVNEGVLIADDRRRVVFANSGFLRMTGLRAEDLVGCDIHSFYTAEEWAFLEKKIEESERVGHNRYEFTIPKKDGSRVPVIISARAHEDSDDRRFGIVTFADISEQKLAQKQLREANQQLSEANEQLEEHQKEIEEDLALAARVQQSLAPKPLVWGGLRVEAYYEPVRTIGGDFGLVSPLEEEHLNLLVCDVSGHGVSSALVANRIYTETIARLGSGAPLPEMLRSLNRFVMQHIGSSLFFFTLAAARIDRDARRMVFAGAGHPPAMIARAGREPRLLESRSMILGVLPDAVDPEGTLDVDLDRGDRVVLYTDGMTDVFDARGEMLGVPGVQKFVGETSLLPFAEMKQGILDRVAAWREGPPSDDVSLVLVEVL